MKSGGQWKNRRERQQSINGEGDLKKKKKRGKDFRWNSGSSPCWLCDLSQVTIPLCVQVSLTFTWH